MNSCAYYQELISTLVDGEISSAEHEALMEHMKSCSACNAMYAVFHDLSDILADEDEPLPKGLHENIMAGVRRSEIMKKNRRMRRFGLSTALTAAACAVLVLFAAAGFAPGKRAESVSIRSEEEIRQQLPASPESALPVSDAAPVTAAPESWPTPAPAELPVQTPAPAQTFAPAAPYPVSSDMNTQYSAPQQSDPYTIDQAAPVYTPAPAEIPYTPMPVQTVAPVPAVITPAPAQAFDPTDARGTSADPVPAAAAPAPVLSAEPAQGLSAPAAVTAPAEAPAQNEAPAASADEGAENGGMMPFSLFSDISSFFSAGPDELTESKLTAEEQTAFSAASPDGPAEDPLPPAEAQDSAVMTEPEAPSLFTLFSAPAVETEEAAPAEPAETAKPEEETVSIYDKTLRARLLAMLGEQEDSLPEAELTRLVHVKLMPEDAYGSEEQVEIRIYGDFVFYTRTTAEGVGKTCRADCSLRDLDSFLLTCKTAGATPTPAPTQDPYIVAPSPTAA